MDDDGACTDFDFGDSVCKFFVFSPRLPLPITTITASLPGPLRWSTRRPSHGLLRPQLQRTLRSGREPATLRGLRLLLLQRAHQRRWNGARTWDQFLKAWTWAIGFGPTNMIQFQTYFNGWWERDRYHLPKQSSTGPWYVRLDVTCFGASLLDSLNLPKPGLEAQAGSLIIFQKSLAPKVGPKRFRSEKTVLKHFRLDWLAWLVQFCEVKGLPVCEGFVSGSEPCLEHIQFFCRRGWLPHGLPSH